MRRLVSVEAPFTLPSRQRVYFRQNGFVEGGEVTGALGFWFPDLPGGVT